jgi:hypothetical protein
LEKKNNNRSSKRKRNCTTEKEPVNQSPTCLNINIMKSTENQCATSGIVSFGVIPIILPFRNMDFFLKSHLCLMLLPTKNAGFCDKK